MIGVAIYPIKQRIGLVNGADTYLRSRSPTKDSHFRIGTTQDLGGSVNTTALHRD